jgi:hypothetical protein
VKYLSAAAAAGHVANSTRPVRGFASAARISTSVSLFMLASILGGIIAPGRAQALKEQRVALRRDYSTEGFSI